MKFVFNYTRVTNRACAESIVSKEFITPAVDVIETKVSSGSSVLEMVFKDLNLFHE